MTQPTPDARRTRQLILNCLTGRAVCPVPRPIDEAAGLLDAYRAAVLREAAELGRELSRQGYSAQEIANRLDRMAEEARS